MIVHRWPRIKTLVISLKHSLLCGSFAILLGGPSQLSQAFQIPSETAPHRDPWGVLPLTQASHRWLGASSCSASACHGGPGAGVSSLQAPRGSEYPLWIESDPHARSWRTLNSDRSVEILQRLHILVDGKIANTAAYQNCLACHNTSTELTSDGISPAIPEGVGCEACHGPSEAWSYSHYQGPRSVQVAIERLGMVNTGSEIVRAKACSLCHIGGPDRDMNHDIIAAGHPALYFDYATYLKAYPKHWREEPQNQPIQALERWLIGQVTKADSELELIESRIASALPHSIWPEFSNYQCTSCHQPLTNFTEDRNLKATGNLPETPSNLGNASVRMWNLEGLESVDRILGSDSQGTKELLDSLQRAGSGRGATESELEGLFDKIEAKREELQSFFSSPNAGRTRSAAPAWTAQQHRTWTREKWESAAASGNWEQAALAYLSTLASSPHQDAKVPMDRLRNRFVFPETTQSPVFPTPQSSLGDSSELQSDSWLADLDLILQFLSP
ncbi:MAG: multiheme c-type cytochrome [Planctomycetota bacterium]|nr:multiheme c-type cytochrome [Planctomycetota bacterium]